ncbi:hypothetical protein [Psychromonas sp. L1A2]|uniref:hypothetical protein n=1 Tax=Psychromonas sp. L1A2 TaxID=2686356 RepID=UPI0022A80208|nr:hypothetical protein [Psychromonas sp. L1A2]
MAFGCYFLSNQDNNLSAIAIDFSKVPFINLSGEVDNIPSSHIGILNLPIVYAELTQLLHYCQTFQNPQHQLNKANKYLISSLVGKGLRIQ